MLINGMNFTVGADPEIFVTKGDKVVSAHGLIPGTKINPFKVKNGAVQVDGMALEFNIDPADNPDQFRQHLSDVQMQLAEMIGDHAFTNSVSNMFDKEYMAEQPYEATELGCSSDFDAYGLCENPTPDAEGTLRTVGGHVHIGGFFPEESPYEDGHFQTCARLTRLLDEQLGVYSILWDKDDQRRSLYGQAGAFRPKQYGTEYRTMSNAWIFGDKLVDFVFDGVKRSIELLFDADYEPDGRVRDIINKSDRSHAFFKGNDRADMIRDMVGA